MRPLPVFNFFVTLGISVYLFTQHEILGGLGFLAAAFAWAHSLTQKHLG